MRIRPGWLFIGCIFLIPYLGTYTLQQFRPSADWQQSSEGLLVHMKQKNSDQILDQETYIAGVLGAVLSPDSHEETIKVMAVVLRTYMCAMAGSGNLLQSDQLNQPWISKSERKAKGVNEEMIWEAIKDTEECIILYNDAPILPLYYALSNGKTRTFSDVWSGSVPYLISVESAWDKTSSDYIQRKAVSKQQWEDAWGDASGDQLQFQIVEKDEAGYINRIQIGAKVVSGEELRCRLGLSSACFEYEIKCGSIEFTCYGQGHGVGLSLFGANAMAKEGKTWQEIIAWYFPGTCV